MSLLDICSDGIARRARKHADKAWRPAEARRFLFLQYETALGTAVCASPIFTALREAVPDANITVAASGLSAEVLRDNPHIDELLITPHPLRAFGAALLHFLFQIRPLRRNFDCVVTDSGNNRFAVSLLSLVSGIRWRVGFTHPRMFHHVALPYDAGASVISNNVRLPRLFGYAGTDPEPVVGYTCEDAAEVGVLLATMKVDEQRPLIALQTGTSGGQPNNWYADRFIQVADWLVRNFNAEIIYVGGAGEKAGIEAIRAQTAVRGHSTAGLTTIPQLAALLTRCDLLVTTDTGTMHVGRAAGVPMVVIANAANPPYQWLPLNDDRHTIVQRGEISCAGCRLCYCSHRSCMDQISVADVTEAIQGRLARTPNLK